MLKARKINRALALISLLSGILFISCSEIIDLELNDPDNQRIVVEGRVTSEFGRQEIRLTNTSSYFKHELAPPLLDIEAYILAEGSGIKYPLELTNDSLGIYSTEEMKGKVGETYSLFIEDEDQSYKATAVLDTVPVMDSITAEYMVYRYFGIRFGMYMMKASFYEPGPEGHIYRVNVFLNDTLYTKDIGEAIYFDDFQINDMYLANIDLFSFPQEDIFLDTNKVRFEFYSLSQDEYNFMIGFFNESYGNGSIYSGPPANIPTNIKNTSDEGIDGVGFFGASGKSVFETTLIKEHNDSTNNPFFQ